jgi:hypothetical protein
MQLQWKLNGGMCVLTQLELVLRGRRAAEAAEGGGFIGALTSSVLGKPLPSAWLDAGTYGLLWAGASAAALRLVWW